MKKPTPPPLRDIREDGRELGLNSKGDNVKDLLGFLLIIGGLLLGAYVGVWLCLVGGIVGLIQASQVTPVVPMDVAINLVKILFSGAVGQFTLLVPVAIGTALLKS